MTIPAWTLLFSLSFVVSAPLSVLEADAYKALLVEWGLSNVAQYASVLTDCPTRNAMAQCFPPDFAIHTKRNRLKFFRAVSRQSLQSKTIPSAIGAFEFLQGLSLRGNVLRGSIPREIARCRELTLLDLLGNHLSGAIPPELGAMRSLEICLLTGQVFDCPIPQLLPICRRQDLQKSCNQTAMLAAQQRKEHGEKLKQEAELLWKKNTGHIVQPEKKVTLEAIDGISLNDPNVSMKDKIEMLKEKRKQLLAQADFIEKQMMNMEAGKKKT